MARSEGADGKKRVSYIGTWITDLLLNKDNIVFLVSAGRSRWKIENEGFNTLKNNGYNLEHNWGHKYGDAPFNFYHLTLLAFYMHQILELTDRLYGYCRSLSHAAYELWNELTVLFRRVVYDCWEDLLCDYVDGYKAHDPPHYTFGGSNFEIESLHFAPMPKISLGVL